MVLGWKQLSAVETVKWEGRTINLKISKKNLTHLIFDEKIGEFISPKEENINIIRNGKNIYFRYNPFIKYKITKDGNKVTKKRDGITYKGNIVKVWFVGEKSKTNYAINFIPGEVKEDTFYIRNSAKKIEESIMQDLEEPRNTKILNLARLAGRGSPIKGYTVEDFYERTKETSRYQTRHIQSWFGGIYNVHIYTLISKSDGVIISEFEFIDLPAKNKVFIGLVSGWGEALSKNQETKIIVVSEK